MSRLVARLIQIQVKATSFTIQLKIEISHFTVFVTALGRVDIKGNKISDNSYECPITNVFTLGLLQCIPKKEVSQFLPYLYEKMFLVIKEENEKRGNKGMMKLTIVVDMEEFSMRQMMYKPGA